MDTTEATQFRSDKTALETLQFREEIQHLMAAPPDNANSFTALLELPAPQAIELLHSPEPRDSPGKLNFAGKSQIKDVQKAPSFDTFDSISFPLPTNSALIERAAKYSVFATGSNNSLNSNSPENSSVCSKQKVKREARETGSNRNESQPLVADPTEESKARRSGKRKEPEKKGKGSSKKSKNEISGDAEKLPYVHVRARRGQATDSHSLAERARREKINARMKLLQELVPGCNKISGTALVLDEIINHVQSLQRQVEFLSMRLATVNPRIDFNLDCVLAPDGGSLVENNFPCMSMPPMWPEVQVSGSTEQYQQQWHFNAIQHPIWGRKEDNQNLVTPENSLLSYDSSANSVSLHSNQVKMEL